MFEMTPLLIAVIAFASVAAIIFVIGRFLENQASINRRLSGPVASSAGSGLIEEAPNNFFTSLAGRVDEKKFGFEGALRTKLRRDLIRAGYFSEAAIPFYVIARIGLILVLPTLTFIFGEIFLGELSFYGKLFLVVIAALLALVGVDAYIARRQRIMQQEYRLTFPDLIDMLVVCVDAGLSLDAALARISPEVAKENPALGVNLILLGAETRAGRSLADALDAFADRLNVDEARAFVLMLRQSLELGTDINDALRVFSDEMRGKRLLRAEENANKLPVKMVLPLGACMFPVILMVILLPVMVSLMGIFNQTR
jgi:tight adherence protein C